MSGEIGSESECTTNVGKLEEAEKGEELTREKDMLVEEEDDFAEGAEEVLQNLEILKEKIDGMEILIKSLKLERGTIAEMIDRLKNENESLKLKIETMEESEKQKQRLDEEELQKSN